MRFILLRDMSLLVIPVMLTSAVLAAEPSTRPRARELPLAPGINAYNPIPSPDGKRIAFVKIDWTRRGLGRSSLSSEVSVMSVRGEPLGWELSAQAFLASWTPNGEALVCFRDYRAFLLRLDGVQYDEVTLPATDPFSRPERVGYLPKQEALVWRTPTEKGDLLETPLRYVGLNADGIHHLGHLHEILSVSPDGRFIAIPGTLETETVLWVYDLVDKTWRKLGPVIIHPSPDWDYLKPSWNPWSRDSSHLAIVSKDEILLLTPDGKQRRRVAKPQFPAGLAACSPDGSAVAYMTFEPTPMNGRADLNFYGGTTVWLARADGSKPVALTAKSPETTLVLSWINASSLVLDRLDQTEFYGHARIWKLELADAAGQERLTR